MKTGSELGVVAQVLTRGQAVSDEARRKPLTIHPFPTRVASKTPYRADIDGLRAIAVLLVLLFHGGNSLFSSGFVGVDVFFVISGFLITSIVLEDLSSNNFSLKQFYVRRAWRLQPAMIAVYIMTLVIATVVYLPPDFVDYLKSGKYATMFLANQYFARTTTAYAADDSSSLMLLHTWSLAIEWQWYFLLAPCLVVLHKNVSQAALRLIAPIAAVVAAGVALTLSAHQPDDNYYSFVSRIFELLIGACVVVLGADRLKLSQTAASLIALVALAVVLYCSTRTGILRGFPDYHALLVSLATAALLIKDVGTKGIHRIVTTGPLPRFIGKVSYSLYLWHWPVLALTAYMSLTHAKYSMVAYYAGSMLLAVTSYALIEKPLRKIKIGLLPTLLILVGIPAVAFSIAYKVAESKNGFPQRFGVDFATSQQALSDYDLKNRRYCIDGVTDLSDARCVMGDINSQSRALMIGDSFSNQYMALMDVLGKDANVSVIALSTSACLALPDVYLYNWWKAKDTLYYTCHDRAVDFYNLIKSNSFKYVVLGQIWANYAGDAVVHSLSDERTVALSRRRVEDSMRNALELIIRTGATPVIIKAIQTMPAGVNECLSQHVLMRDLMDSPEVSARCTSTPQSPKESDWFESLFVELKHEFPTIRFIDPKDIQCDDGVCKTVLNGVPVYRDIGHITDYASRKLGEQYLRKFANPLKQLTLRKFKNVRTEKTDQ